MKKRSLHLFLLTAAVVGFGLTMPATAQIQLGVTGGLNFNRLTDVVLNDVDATFDNKSGWHVGAWVDVSLGPIGLRPGLRYMQAGELFNGLSDINSSISDDFDITLVEIPILLRYGFGAPAVKPYLFAGPVLRFPAGVDELIEEDLKSSSFAGELGLGVELNLGGIHLYPEIAFTFGLTSFVEDEITIGLVRFEADDSQNLNVAMLRLGIGL